MLIHKVLNIECYCTYWVYCPLCTRYSSLDNEVVNNLWGDFTIMKNIDNNKDKLMLLIQISNNQFKIYNVNFNYGSNSKLNMWTETGNDLE